MSKEFRQIISVAKHKERADLAAAAGRIIAEDADALRGALYRLLERYLSLANSGDCGFWNPEEEDEVIEARAALSRLERSGGTNG